MAFSMPARFAIQPAAKRALPAMLRHRQMGRLDCFWGLSAGQAAEDVVFLDAMIGVDQLAGELIEMRTAKGIHDAPPSSRFWSCGEDPQRAWNGITNAVVKLED